MKINIAVTITNEEGQILSNETIKVDLGADRAVEAVETPKEVKVDPSGEAWAEAVNELTARYEVPTENDGAGVPAFFEGSDAEILYGFTNELVVLIGKYDPKPEAAFDIDVELNNVNIIKDNQSELYHNLMSIIGRLSAE